MGESWARYAIAVPLGFGRGLVGIWAGLVPEESVVGAEGANVEIDVEREGFEEDGEGGFQGCDTGGHAS